MASIGIPRLLTKSISFPGMSTTVSLLQKTVESCWTATGILINQLDCSLRSNKMPQQTNRPALHTQSTFDKMIIQPQRQASFYKKNVFLDKKNNRFGILKSVVWKTVWIFTQLFCSLCNRSRKCHNSASRTQFIFLAQVKVYFLR